MKHQDIIRSIENSGDTLGQGSLDYLRGLLQLKPLTYWDYIEVDTLLSIQRPRTDYKDEEIFIMYHQVTELLLKLMLHEIRQLSGPALVPQESFVLRLRRMNRYTGMLINSFDIMKEGMSYEDYNTFRCALAPASGFQSVQFRYVELHCTRLHNLVNAKGKENLPANPSLNDYFENIYWRAAGVDHRTGQKTKTLQLFEDRYLNDLKRLARGLNGFTIEEKLYGFETLQPELIAEMREFDWLYNVEWPLVHLETAKHFLDKRGENKAATGGSQWQRYLHPAHQQRRFFPRVWTPDEIAMWGQKKSATMPLSHEELR